MVEFEFSYIKEIIYIDENCLKSFPSKHKIKFKTNNGEIKTESLVASEIIKLCREKERAVSNHIRECAGRNP